MDAKTSSELALNLNRKSADFFKAYAEKFADTQGKQILLDFADQEKLHSDRIRKHLEEMEEAPGA